jgi:hypothetical protein
MSKSKRHHFIPVFYLKHFTNDDGFFYMYDVKKGKIKNNGQRFAPSTHFYEHHGNTFFNGIESTEFIESSFTNWDTRVANIYKKIVNRDEGEGYTLNSVEWTMLQYFVNIMYWRNPSNTDKVKAYIRNASSISDLKLKIMDRSTGNRASNEKEVEMLELIKADPEFYKFLKLMLPMITFPEIFKKKENDFAHIFPFPNGLPKLVSDNPIIYRNIEGESLHTDEFIFPLTPTQILIRNRMKGIIVYSPIRVLIDMMLLIQAREYVSCTDLKYPLLLQAAYKTSYSSVEHLREDIFKHIFLKIDKLD